MFKKAKERVAERIKIAEESLDLIYAEKKRSTAPKSRRFKTAKANDVFMGPQPRYKAY